jgi:glycosyltransferase involved in cell wall biosynthesis
VEAMACGCPVITSNVSSMPEIAGSSALLIDPKDTSQIADRLMLLSQDKDLRRRMVEEGLSQSQQFTYKKMAERWLEVVNQRFK